MVEWTAYVDESGKDGKSSHFVLVCITGSPENLTRLIDSMRGFKRGLVPRSDPDVWELHGKNIMRGYRYPKNQGPRIKNLTQKIAIFNAIVNLVSEFDIIILGTLITNKKLSKKYDQDQVLESAMTTLFEHLEQFEYTTSIDTIRIVSDYVLPTEQKTIATAFDNFRHASGIIQKIQTSRVTGIDYVDSQDDVLIQTADIIAYVINRYRNGDKNFESVFAKLTESGKTYGGGTQCPFTIS